MTSIPTLSILNAHISGNVIGFGIIKLPTRSIFQSISDYFARKSGNERISFIVVSDQEIKAIHTRGTEVIDSVTIDTNSIAEIKAWNKSSHEPKQLDVQIRTEKPGKKEGDVISKMYDFEIFPAFLGENTSKIEKVSAVLEHKKQFENLISYFSEWKKA
jgi:hypothetical protein